MPTLVEWQAEAANWTNSDKATDAFASPLKLVVAGFRSHDDGSGSLGHAGSVGYYWSSTAATSRYSYYSSFHGSGTGMSIGHRAYGFSVRCIKD